MIQPLQDRYRSFIWIAPLLLLALAQGCSGGGGSTIQVVATAADSTALQEARQIEDGAARFAALQEFVSKRPGNPLRGDAYPQLIDLAREHAPAQVEPLIRAFMKDDYSSSNPYNAVGWDLAVAGEHLDLAVPILERAVAKARVENDPMNLASCLDSEAWARFRAGDAAAAVKPMEEARSLLEEKNDELEDHMARIYEAAGMPEKAKPIYIDLLSHMEHPEYRESLAKIVTASGESMDELNAEIQRRRLEGATPVPDFTLPSQSGGPSISLAEHRGKVILLNFWHYT